MNKFVQDRFPSFTSEYLEKALCTNMKFCPMEFEFIDEDGNCQKIIGTRCWDWLKINEQPYWKNDEELYKNNGPEYINVWNLEKHIWTKISFRSLLDFRLIAFNGVRYFK